MKRTRIFALVLAAALLLCGCSGGAAAKANQNLPDHSNEPDDLGIEWLYAAPLQKEPVGLWHRFLYKIA